MIKKLVPLLAGKIISWITFKKVFLLALIALVSIMLLTLFEGRKTLIGLWGNDDTSPVEIQLNISSSMKKRFETLVIRSDEIVGVTVVSANLRTNQRTTIHWFIDDAVVEEAYTEFIKTRGAITPIFNTDQNNSEQMVSVINGEFSCSKIEDTPSFRVVPRLVSRVSNVCRIGLPPYYGDFNGYVSFLLKKPATDQDEIRVEAVRLANDLYRESIVNRPN